MAITGKKTKYSTGVICATIVSFFAIVEFKPEWLGAPSNADKAIARVVYDASNFRSMSAVEFCDSQGDIAPEQIRVADNLYTISVLDSACTKITGCSSDTLCGTTIQMYGRAAVSSGDLKRPVSFSKTDNQTISPHRR